MINVCNWGISYLMINRGVDVSQRMAWNIKKRGKKNVQKWRRFFCRLIGWIQRKYEQLENRFLGSKNLFLKCFELIFESKSRFYKGK